MQNLGDLLEARDIVAIDRLVALAGDSRAAGDDIKAAFIQQAELRSKAAADLHAQLTGDRVSLHASDQRTHDRHLREVEQILGLIRQIEARTQYRPPASVSDPGGDAPAAGDVPAVLKRGESLVDWQRRRAGRVDAGPAPRPGAVLRAYATGNRTGLTASEARALSEGLGPDGGYTVPEVLGAQVIDRLRNRSVAFTAGAATVPMTSNVLHLARVGQPDSVSPSIPGPQWKAENELIEEGGLALERVTFTARTLPLIIRASVECAEDSPNLDEILEREMSSQLALELDRVATLGTGNAPEPRGVRYQSGVNVQSHAGSPLSNFDPLVDALGRLWARNVEPTGYMLNASLATSLAKLKSSADDQPLRMPDVVAAVPRYRTQQIPNDNVSPNTTTLFTADWSQLMIGIRTSFKLELSRTDSDSFNRLQIAFRCYLRADVQLAHAASFDVLTDVSF